MRVVAVPNEFEIIFDEYDGINKVHYYSLAPDKFTLGDELPYFDPTNYTDEQIVERVKRLLVFL